MDTLTEKFYRKTLRPDRQHSYNIITKYIIDNIKPDLSSVVDYGCGAGWFLYHFKKHGITDLVGIEPNKEMIPVLDESIKDYIRFLSLTEEIDLDRHFDLAMNIEVVEHIDEVYADKAIINITRHTDLLVFSAATPGQGGYGHINEQPFIYWEDKLSDINLYCDKEETQKFRNYLGINKANPWYVNNISVFERRI